MRRLIPAALVLAGFARVAAAGTVTGTVFADLDGDGRRGEGEPGVATVVAWEDQVFARTAADGSFALDVPYDGLVWARAPDGFRPGPTWAATDGGTPLALALAPVAPAGDGPVTFVIGSDVHVHDSPRYATAADLDAALAQATALDPAPRFLALLGDLTQSTQPEEIEEIARATAALRTPWVPVAGNHDWYDDGASWRARFGPASYSFDVGAVHVAVMDSNQPPASLVGFLEHDLAFVDPGATVVVLAHHPQPADVIERMKAGGVDLFLAGHWHTNREVRHGSLLELDTGPFLMGGMDGTPAAYRVITIRDGAIEVANHDVVRAPWLRLAAPVGARCLVAGAPLIAAAEIDARAFTVIATVGGHTVELAPVGGWAYAAAAPRLPRGRHRVRLEARAGERVLAATDADVEVCAPPTAPVAVAPWPQPGGDAAHRGRQERAIEPPLVERWATAVGGPLAAAPVSDGIRIVVAVARGVVALDAATGAILWRVDTTAPVRAAPIVVGGLVIAVEEDGVVRALDAATGAERWRRDLGEGLDAVAAFAPAVAEAGVVYVGGPRRFAALDAATGEPRWTVDPVPDATWHFTLAGPAVAGDLVIATFERSRGGLRAWTRDGTPAWTVPPDVLFATDAAPVVDGDTVYVATGTGDLVAIDARDGHVRWTRMLTDDHHSWGYAIRATPAISGDTILVATEHDLLWALDAATGDARWTWSPPGDSPVHAAHYRSRGRGFASSPVITGDVVWAAATDGTLVALDLSTGAVRQRLELGAPVLAGLAAAGELLIVAGWDGTVHAFAAAPPAPPSPPLHVPILELAAAALIALRVAVGARGRIARRIKR